MSKPSRLNGDITQKKVQYQNFSVLHATELPQSVEDAVYSKVLWVGVKKYLFQHNLDLCSQYSETGDHKVIEHILDYKKSHILSTCNLT